VTKFDGMVGVALLSRHLYRLNNPAHLSNTYWVRVQAQAQALKPVAHNSLDILLPVTSGIGLTRKVPSKRMQVDRGLSPTVALL
jgi:hypothetical protein